MSKGLASGASRELTVPPDPGLAVTLTQKVTAGEPLPRVRSRDWCHYSEINRVQTQSPRDPEVLFMADLWLLGA